MLLVLGEPGGLGDLRLGLLAGLWGPGEAPSQPQCEEAPLRLQELLLATSRRGCDSVDSTRNCYPTQVKSPDVKNVELGISAASQPMTHWIRPNPTAVQENDPHGPVIESLRRHNMWLINSHWHVVSRGSIASAAELIRTLQATLIGSGGSPGQVPEGSESAATGMDLPSPC